MPFPTISLIVKALLPVLLVFSQFGWAAPVLNVDVTDSNSYGYAFNSVYTNQTIAEFEFSQVSGDLILSLDAYDIDTTTEVSIELNGAPIGYLPKSANNGIVSSSVTISQSNQVTGTNNLRFIQSQPGWIWGITNLTLTNQNNPVLQLGVTNTNLYGNIFFGVSNYPNSVSFSIPASDNGFDLSLEGFDIDGAAEVSVIVNGQSIGALSVTPNNALASDNITIPSSALNTTGNLLTFVQNTPGWIWGVTNLLLTEQTANTLVIDQLDSENYGFAYDGLYTNRDSANFAFTPNGSALILTVETFDIDSGSEITVLLNGQIIGNLATTSNNGTGTSTLALPLTMQISGVNTLEFIQSTSGWKWGITDLLLSNANALRLTPDITDTASYGYSYYGTNSNPENVEFLFASPSNNLNLVMTTYDIDLDDEVAVELNGILLGYLKTTANNTEGVTELLIPAHLQINGDNSLTFRQKNINWRWGISNILLQSQPSLLPNISDYDLVFSDEFDSGALDTAKWNTGMLWGPYLPINNEQQLYVDTLGINQGFSHSPFTFSADTLTISATATTAQLQPPTRPAQTNPVWDDYAEYQYNGANANSPGYLAENVDYLSGIITSYDSFKMTHGYVETRAKLPAGKGLWPAFWLLNSHYIEDAPEIDIMEFLGDGTDTIYHTYHYFDTSNGWQKISTPSYETIGPDWTNSFHTFGLAWSPRELVWYVDGVETKRITDADYKISSQAMYLIANLAVGGNWPGAPDSSTVFPAEYEIDYIRAYKRKLAPSLDLANDYQLMFNDEFNGSTLDTDKWNTAFLWGPYLSINNEEQYYVDSNGTDASKSYSPFSLDSGVLTITAQASSDSGSDVPPASLPGPNSTIWSENPEFQQGPYAGAPDYTSGVITSYDAFKFVNGYAEIRAKVPSGDGLWPAFWLLNAYYVGTLPEIDIMEILGENPGQAYHTFHRSNTNGVVLSDQQTSNAQNNTLGYADGFHTFGVRWEPGKITWYVDGSPVHIYEEPIANDNDAYQLMYVIANLAVGGNFNSQPVDDSALPAEYQIDYIRVYQETDTP